MHRHVRAESIQNRRDGNSGETGFALYSEAGSGFSNSPPTRASQLPQRLIKKNLASSENVKTLSIYSAQECNSSVWCRQHWWGAGGGGGYLQFYRMLLLVPPRVEVMWQSMFVDLSVSRNGHGAAHYLGDVPDSRGSLSFDLPKIKGQRGFAVTM